MHDEKTLDEYRRTALLLGKDFRLVNSCRPDLMAEIAAWCSGEYVQSKGVIALPLRGGYADDGFLIVKEADRFRMILSPDLPNDAALILPEGVQVFVDFVWQSEEATEENGEQPDWIVVAPDGRIAGVFQSEDPHDDSFDLWTFLRGMAFALGKAV